MVINVPRSATALPINQAPKSYAIIGTNHTAEIPCRSLIIAFDSARIVLFVINLIARLFIFVVNDYIIMMLLLVIVPQ